MDRIPPLVFVLLTSGTAMVRRFLLTLYSGMLRILSTLNAQIVQESNNDIAWSDVSVSGVKCQPSQNWGQN